MSHSAHQQLVIYDYLLCTYMYIHSMILCAQKRGEEFRGHPIDINHSGLQAEKAEEY